MDGHSAEKQAKGLPRHQINEIAKSAPLRHILAMKRWPESPLRES